MDCRRSIKGNDGSYWTLPVGSNSKVHAENKQSGTKRIHFVIEAPYCSLHIINKHSASYQNSSDRVKTRIHAGFKDIVESIGMIFGDVIQFAMSQSFVDNETVRRYLLEQSSSISKRLTSLGTSRPLDIDQSAALIFTREYTEREYNFFTVVSVNYPLSRNYVMHSGSCYLVCHHCLHSTSRSQIRYKNRLGGSHWNRRNHVLFSLQDQTWKCGW